MYASKKKSQQLPSTWAKRQKTENSPQPQPHCKTCTQPLVQKIAGENSKNPGRAFWACPGRCFTNIEKESSWIGWVDEYLPETSVWTPPHGEKKNDVNKSLELLKEIKNKIQQVLDQQLVLNNFVTNKNSGQRQEAEADASAEEEDD